MGMLGRLWLRMGSVRGRNDIGPERSKMVSLPEVPLGHHFRLNFRFL